MLLIVIALRRKPYAYCYTVGGYMVADQGKVGAPTCCSCNAQTTTRIIKGNNTIENIITI